MGSLGLLRLTPLGQERAQVALTAAITVNAPGVPVGSAVPCTVKLHYNKVGNTVQTVSWSGVVSFVSSGKHLVQIGPHAFAIVPNSSGIPLWAWILGSLLVACLLAAAAVALVLYRRRAHGRHNLTS